MSTKLIPLASLSIATLLFLRSLAFAAPPAALRDATQLLVVIAPTWDSSDGMARPYERPRHRGPWQTAGPSFAVKLGRGGLGWRSDRGAPPPPSGAPLKQEGDGRSPAGALLLGDMWGYDATAPAGVSLPYHAAGPLDRCVDDAGAAAYGQLVLAPPVPPWRSAEELRRSDDLYRYLLVIRYNMDHSIPGAGSCIFFHLWGEARGPTAGCTATAKDDLLRLSRWLRPAARPVLVQLPAAAYARLRDSWGLP